MRCWSCFAVARKSELHDEIGIDSVKELHNDEIGVDRTIELPDEIVLAILSFLSLREAVATSVLSSRWSDLWKHTPNLKFDRISKLPDKIIIFILSLLSPREAAATSVLSSRWSDLWKRTPSINFNAHFLKITDFCKANNVEELFMLHPFRRHGRTWDVERCKYVRMVNSILQSHKALTLREFRIILYANKSAQSTVIEWLEYVFSRRVERLELDFECDEPEYMVSLPETLVLSKSLKRVCLSHLRVSGEAINLFLHNCPMLEQLVIQYSVLTSDVVVNCGTSLMLKQLDIYSCSGEISIKVSAPNLVWFRLHTSSEKVILENIPKHVLADDVMLFASAVFGCISRMKFLNLTLYCPKVVLSNGIPKMPELIKMAVTYNGVCGHGLLPVTHLIWASPHLQEFKLEFNRIHTDLIAWKEHTDEVSTKRHPHRHLKVFRFIGYSAHAKDHIQLLTYILDNCVALEKIILDVPSKMKYVTNTELVLQTGKNLVKRQLHGKVPCHIELRIV